MKFPPYGILHRMRSGWVFPWISRNMGKCCKISSYEKNLKYLSPYFFQIDLFHQISILWYTSSYGWYTDFPTKNRSMIKLNEAMNIIWEEPGTLMPIFQDISYFSSVEPLSHGILKKDDLHNFFRVVSSFSYNFHRIDLEIFCYSSSIIWNKNKFPWPQGTNLIVDTLL